MKRNWRARWQRSGFLASAFAFGPAALAWAWMLWEGWTRRQWSCCHPEATSVDEARGWALMVLAMMLPFTRDSLLRTAERSYRQRRARAVLAYLAGFLGVWLLPLIVLLPLRRYPLGHEALLATGLCLLGAAWSLHPWRARLFQRCHREIPLRPLGWQADCDALRQGAIQSFPCLGGCLFLMLACAITHHHMVMMIGGTLLAGMERRMFRFRSAPLAAGALGLAGWTLLLAS